MPRYNNQMMPNEYGTPYMLSSPQQETVIDTIQKTEQSRSPSNDQSQSPMSKEVAMATAQGAQSGGLSGALISGGVTSMLGPAGMAGAGPYAAAGGLILSQIEAAQKAKAAQEQERISNEKSRRTAMAGQFNSMAGQRFGV